MLNRLNRVLNSQTLLYNNIARTSVLYYSTKTQHKRVFPLLDGSIDTSTVQYTENVNCSQASIATYQKLLNVALAGGGAKGIERHVKYNKKLSPLNRMKLLFDDHGSVLELAPLAGMKMKYGDIPRGGVLGAIGKINGVYCVVSQNDATVKAGTMYPISVKKQLRIQEISIQNRLPLIFIVDSGGAFLPLQAEIFADKSQGGRVFYNTAVANSLDIPQLAVVCGSCTAGGAYIPTMVQQNIIVDKIGTIFLGGPPLVKAALGEEVSPEDLGGATLHCNVSGCTDYFAATEEEAFATGRDIVATFNIEPPLNREGYDEPVYDPDELLGIIPAKDQHTMDMHKVIARLTDGSRFLEFKRNYGKGLVTGFAFLQGHLIGIVAENGDSTAKSAEKGAHFVQLCDQKHLPIIFLQNTTPQLRSEFTIKDAKDDNSTLRAEAKMMAMIACCTVPKITVIVGNSIGSYNMCPRSFNPNFLFTWPNAQIAMESQDQIVDAMMKCHGNSTDKDTQEKIAKEVMSKTGAIYIASQLYSDGIILPHDTRKILGQCLDIIAQNRLREISKYSVIRM